MTDLELQTLIKNACKAAGWPIKKTLQDDSNKAARMAVLRCAGMIGEAME